MKENENVNNQDDALKDTVNPDMESTQKPTDDQPKQEETKEATSDNVSDKKSKRFKIRHAAEKALEEEKAKYAELNDKFLRLFSEFDNFRKRTAKEKLDLTVTASENVIKDILPVLDDFERALQNMEKNGNEADLQGVTLIYGEERQRSRHARRHLDLQQVERHLEKERFGGNRSHGSRVQHRRTRSLDDDTRP